MPAQSRIVYPVKSGKVRQTRPFPRRALFWLAGVFGSAVLVAGFAYLVNLPQIRLRNIEIGGAVSLFKDDVEKEIRGYASGRILSVLPRDNFLLISASGLERSLIAKFPQASEISVSKKFPATLVVDIRERVFWGAYCETPPAADPAPPCFYIDARGIAYERLSDFKGLIIPVIYSPAEVALGNVAATPDTLSFFGRSKKALAGLDINLLSLALGTSTPADARLNFGEGWHALVTPMRPVEEWFGVLKTILEKEIGDKRGQLDYVDLRFGNKVFYKYR